MRLEPRVNVSRPLSIDARAANANSTHQAAASGARNSAANVRICARVFVRKPSLPVSNAASIQNKLKRANARSTPAATRAAPGRTATLAANGVGAAATGVMSVARARQVLIAIAVANS